ncbi:MAG: hypothetical protein QXY41_07400 [Thermoproteota archaeon]
MYSGVFSGIKNLSPNAQIKADQNMIEIVIPKTDLINQLKASIPDNIKPFVEVEYTLDGIVLKVKLM